MADGEGKTMLGKEQLEFVRQWIDETSGASARFVVSPVPVSASVQVRMFVHGRACSADAQRVIEAR